MQKELQFVFIITKDEDGNLELFEITGGTDNHSEPTKEILSNFLEFQNNISSLMAALRIAEQFGVKEEANRLVEVITQLIRFRGKHYAIPAGLAVLEASGERPDRDMVSPERHQQLQKVR